MPIYAQRIRELRQHNSLTQPQFADRIGTTKNQISKYELNKEPIPVKHIIKICEEFCVSADWLLGIDREDTAAELSKYNNIRNEIHRTVKTIEKANLTKEERTVLLDQLQKLIDNL